MKRTLITSALPYANGYLHLGHCAGAYLPADIYARFKRLKGEELLYICGSDEHGVAITIAAEKEKVTPQDIIDKYHYANKAAFEKFGMSFDIYSRTSIPRHHETAKEFFKDFYDKELLREKNEKQFYDPKANMFLPDRYVEGECPNCGAEGARGDQCDSCGAYYDQLELKNPKSLVSGETPVAKETTHWYMRFDKFQEFLENYIEGHAGEWKDNVIQQTRSWLKQGLNERAITRDLEWGVKINDIEGVPADKASGKALYVWFEAVLGYISATKELIAQIEADGKQAKDWKYWWQSKDTRYIAFIGKDNIVFHTLIFPALLHAKGENYILPDNVPANEFLNLEGQKFSKSRNWSIDLQDFIKEFPETNRVDALRYTLAMSFPETKDADFTWKDYQARNNNELAAIFGNFVNRTLQFAGKNFGNKVANLPEKYSSFIDDWKNFAEYINENEIDAIDNISAEYKEKFSENDLLVLYSLTNGIKKANNLYERFRFRDAITETMNIARASNKYFNDEEPWKTSKNAPEECSKTMYVCLQLVRSLAVLFAPVVPFASENIFNILGIEGYTGCSEKGFPLSENFWNNAAYPQLEEGKTFEKPDILFTKVEDELVAEQVEKLGRKSAKQAAAAKEDKELANLIGFEDFMNVKLRTGIIISAEKIKKAKKLLKLNIDIGSSERQIVAGIAEHYNPEELIGKAVIVVANLKPAKLMGVESQGMLLAATNSEGKLTLATIENKEIGIGAEVR